MHPVDYKYTWEACCGTVGGSGHVDARRSYSRADAAKSVVEHAEQRGLLKDSEVVKVWLDGGQEGKTMHVVAVLRRVDYAIVSSSVVNEYEAL